MLAEPIRVAFSAALPETAASLNTRRADEINREVFSILDAAADEGRPLFLFINFMDAHWPYEPPEPFDTRYPGKDSTFTERDLRRMEQEIFGRERNIAQHEREHLESQYDGAIAYLDAHIGQLLDKLKRIDQFRDSLIIATADHGEAFGDRHLVGHGTSVYQDQVHVPLVIKYPVQRGPRRDARLVGSVDILPTILDVIDEPAPKNLSGRSLLEDEGSPFREVVSESFPSTRLGNHEQRAVLSGEHKLIVSPSRQPELYDLSDDPGEAQNLVDRYATKAKSLEALLLAHQAPQSADDQQPMQLDKVTLERLRSLGYVR